MLVWSPICRLQSALPITALACFALTAVDSDEDFSTQTKYLQTDKPKFAHDSLADRSQFYKDIAGNPFFGANRPGAKVSQGMMDSFWLQGVQAGHKNTFDSIRVLSETDFTEDLKKFDVPMQIIHDGDQIVPIGTAAILSSKTRFLKFTKMPLTALLRRTKNNSMLIFWNSSSHGVACAIR